MKSQHYARLHSVTIHRFAQCHRFHIATINVRRWQQKAASLLPLTEQSCKYRLHTGYPRYSTMGRRISPKCSFLGGPRLYMVPGAHSSPPHTASRLVQPFRHRSRLWSTDIHTDHATSVAIDCIYTLCACDAALWSVENSSNIFQILKTLKRDKQKTFHISDIRHKFPNTRYIYTYSSKPFFLVYGGLEKIYDWFFS